MTNSQLTDLRTLILSEVGDFFAVVGSPGEPETPEEMQRELSMRLGRILNNHIVNYPRCEVLVEILRECRTARDEAQAELQERRKPLLDKDLQGVIGALEHPAGINAAGKQVVRLALVELQERRKADSEPVASNYRKLFTCTGCGAEGLDEPLETNCHCCVDGAHWVESRLYRHEQPVPVVPDELAKAFISAIEKEQDRLSDEDYLMDSRDCIDVIREELERLNPGMLAVASQEAK
ncbi:hypothetical protein RW675_24025 [Klebsiella aerogenes]|uniref:hypothetical protein n=1 Tax=Klebsiella aerogenes TaxID=548 RepID=UPI00291BA0E1|nr:hypothetical protein [Klebsiella aerogenes]MDU9143608.1 hypothetical protein [Klebsiella aerogenes]